MGQSPMKGKRWNCRAGTVDPFSPKSGYVKVNMKLPGSAEPQGAGPAHQSPDSVSPSRVEIRTVRQHEEPSNCGHPPERSKAAGVSWVCTLQEGLLVPGRLLVTRESSELILLSQHVGKLSGKDSGA